MTLWTGALISRWGSGGFRGVGLKAWIRKWSRLKGFRGLEKVGAFKFRAKGPFIAIAQIHE